MKNNARAKRVRVKTKGSGISPRLSVFRSNKFVYAQLINDDKGETIVSASEKELKAEGKKEERAKALGALIAKKALANLSSLTVAGARMALGSVFIFLVVLAQGNAGQLLALNATQWGWTLLTSVLLLGYVTTWYTALKIAPATLVAALLVPATLITNVLNGIFITHSITLLQIYNGLLLILGTTLIIRGNARFRVHPRVNPPISAPTYD